MIVTVHDCGSKRGGLAWSNPCYDDGTPTDLSDWTPDERQALAEVLVEQVEAWDKRPEERSTYQFAVREVWRAGTKPLLHHQNVDVFINYGPLGTKWEKGKYRFVQYETKTAYPFAGTCLVEIVAPSHGVCEFAGTKVRYAIEHVRPAEP